MRVYILSSTLILILEPLALGISLTPELIGGGGGGRGGRGGGGGRGGWAAWTIFNMVISILTIRYCADYL